MYNENRTPLDKALGAISILSDPTPKKMQWIAKMYSIPWNVIKALITPVNVKGRIIYLSIDKAKTVKQKRLERTQWAKEKSQELRRGHLPVTVCNNRHARGTFSGTAKSPQDLDTKSMRRKVVSELTESKKGHINSEWEKLTSH